jgi:hypothetical protein
MFGLSYWLLPLIAAAVWLGMLNAHLVYTDFQD